MPSRDWRLRIQDILECIEKVQQYTDGMTFEDFAADQKTVDAVLRNFTIIGEAARNVPDDICGRFPHIPWDKMRAMRNVVVHEYFGISLRIIWLTVQSDLPPLVEPLRLILETQTES